MSEDILLIERNGAVVELTLNRPNVMNALSRALTDLLTDVFKELSADDSLRAIILTGAGRGFCAGVDLKELSEDTGAIEKMKWTGRDSLLDVIRECPHPLICAVNGVAVTGGLELAMMSDFMIAAEEARFADTHARVGITPSWGMTQVLPRLVGVNRARQMSLTGEFINAQKACDWGLVTEVMAAEALMPRARALAQQIAETDRLTMGRLRDLIRVSEDSVLKDGLAAEVSLFGTHIAGVSQKQVGTNRAAVIKRGRSIAANEEQG